MSSPNTKKILTVAVSILVIAGSFYFMFAKKPTVLTSNATTEDGSQIASQDILVLINKLRAVSVDASIFSSVLFTNLKDLGVPISQEPQGRPNPFALIGVDSGISVDNKFSNKTPGI